MKLFIHNNVLGVLVLAACVVLLIEISLIFSNIGLVDCWEVTCQITEHMTDCLYKEPCLPNVPITCSGTRACQAIHISSPWACGSSWGQALCSTQAGETFLWTHPWHGKGKQPFCAYYENFIKDCFTCVEYECEWQHVIYEFNKREEGGSFIIHFRRLQMPTVRYFH